MPRPVAIPAVTVCAVLLTALASGGAVALSPSAPPETVAPSGPHLVEDPGALPLTPMPGGIVDAQPVPWDQVTIWPDGRTLTVVFWNGPEPCFGLDRVEVTDTDGVPSVTPWVGVRADATDVRCTADLQRFSTVVELPDPILGGGVPDQPGVGWIDGPGTRIEPGAILASDRGTRWERVAVAADGRTLLVHFMGGIPECFGLDRVDLPVMDGLQMVSVRYGMLADGPDACILPGRHYAAVATLDAPVLLGGAG